MTENGSPLKLGPSVSKRRKVGLCRDKCVICQKGSIETVVLFTPNSRSTYFSATERRKDDVYNHLISEFGSFDLVPKESLDIVYHKRCYKSYTSEHNIMVHIKKQVGYTETESVKSSQVSGTFTRSKSSAIDWSSCVICSKKSYKQDKRLLKLETDERVNRLSNAAHYYVDSCLLLKISHDNFKEQAFYHNQCMTKYLVGVNRSTNENTQMVSEIAAVHESTFLSLISVISDDLMKHKKAFILSSLLQMYNSYLPSDLPRELSAKSLQRKLEAHFGDSIAVQTQQGQGKSNIIMSSTITLGDAIKAATNLKAELKLSQEKTGKLDPKVTLSDDQLIHSVARIIRRDIENVQFSSDNYPTSNEVSFEYAIQSLPHSLLKLLSWLTDEKAFRNCAIPSDSKPEKIRKCLALGECMVAISRNITTPFHLGLAIQVHHEFGSMRLIEILNAHGLCVTYTELRRYLTSVANHETQRINGDRYIPWGIKPISRGGRLIQEGSNNIDLNSETLDGKNTFHSLARVVFQTKSTDNCTGSLERIKRGSERSLTIDDTTSSLTDAIPFSKPKIRAEPQRRKDVVLQIQTCDPDFSVKDQIWVISRLLSRNMIEFPIAFDIQEQTFPFWTGFNCLLSEKSDDVTQVAYPQSLTLSQLIWPLCTRL